LVVSCSKAHFGRLAVAALLAGGIVAAWRWRGLFDPLALTKLIGGNPMAALVFLGVHIAASLFFVPRTLLALGAGLVFGMWWGIIWAALGSVLGALAGFLAARYLHSGFVGAGFVGAGFAGSGLVGRAGSAKSARLAALLARVERGGWRAVAVVRLVPVIPHSLANYALGLTRVRVAAYAFGSLIGQLPLTVAYADLGAAGGRALLGAEVLWPSLIGVAALALSLLIPVVARRRLRQAQPKSEAMPAAIPGTISGA
jgi:uncharacterized membrane protein YdjX (TVP38/TMEM64 family)